MKLFLASEAKNPATIERLRKYIDGFSGKSIAYIPTAANGEEDFGSWKENSSTWKLVQTLGADVTAVQLEDFKHSSPIDILQSKDIIWMAGGWCGYLMYWLHRSGVAKEIRKLLEESVYVGSSAGSMVAAKTLDVATWYAGEMEISAKFLPGLGLVDFDIYPHYEESQLEHIKQNYKGNKLYLLKDGEELLVEGERVTVQGKERVIPSNVVK